MQKKAMFTKRTGLIFGLSAALLLIVHIFWLAWLFWGMTLAGMFWIPAMFIISLIAGAGIFLFMGGIIKARKFFAISISFLIFIAVLLFQIGGYPVNDGLFNRIGNYWDTFWKYPDGIKYEDLFRDGPRQYAALVKYADEIPDKAFVIEFYQGAEPAAIYYAVFKDDNIEYDSTRYQLLETGENLTLIIKSDNLNGEEYILSGNYARWLNTPSNIVQGGHQNGYMIYYHSMDFKDVSTYQEGAAKIFNFLIIHFR